MTFSDVLYEAACRMSDANPFSTEYSCNMVADVELGSEWLGADREPRPSLSVKYGRLINVHARDVVMAADELDLSANEFRTFLLLMASEVVK